MTGNRAASTAGLPVRQVLIHILHQRLSAGPVVYLSFFVKLVHELFVFFYIFLQRSQSAVIGNYIFNIGIFVVFHTKAVFKICFLSAPTEVRRFLTYSSIYALWEDATNILLTGIDDL